MTPGFLVLQDKDKHVTPSQIIVTCYISWWWTPISGAQEDSYGISALTIQPWQLCLPFPSLEPWSVTWDFTHNTFSRAKFTKFKSGGHAFFLLLDFYVKCVLCCRFKLFAILKEALKVIADSFSTMLISLASL